MLNLIAYHVSYPVLFLTLSKHVPLYFFQHELRFNPKQEKKLQLRAKLKNKFTGISYFATIFAILFYRI